MAMTRRNNKNDSIILNTIEELVPQDHDIRMLESCIDWNFIYPLVENLYSDVGRPSIDLWFFLNDLHQYYFRNRFNEKDLQRNTGKPCVSLVSGNLHG